MNNYNQEFEVSWKRFETNLRGKLMAKVKEQKLTVGLANLLLKDASANWFSMYQLEGKNLINYTKEKPDKGKIINDILKNDMKFNEEIKSSDIAPGFKMLIAVVLGCAGMLIAFIMHATLLQKAASFAVPAILGYLLISSVEKNVNGDAEGKVVDQYIAQLDKFKKSIVSVIEN